MLATVIRKLGPRPTLRERVQVQKQRLKLLERINRFHDQAGRLWQFELQEMHMSESAAAEDLLAPVEDSDLLASDDEWSDTNPFNTSPLNRPNSAERLAIALPSAIGMEKSIELGYKRFAKAEKALRIGQLNDALQNIRLGLSQKAVVFREGLRRVKSKVKKTRSWHQISQVDSSVRHHARVYTRARAAIVQLGATEEELDRYKVLQSSDLNVSTARVDPSARGNRDKGLAWFWTMDVGGDSDAAGRMGECEHPLTIYVCVVLC